MTKSIGQNLKSIWTNATNTKTKKALCATGAVALALGIAIAILASQHMLQSTFNNSSAWLQNHVFTPISSAAHNHPLLSTAIGTGAGVIAGGVGVGLITRERNYDLTPDQKKRMTIVREDD